MVMLRWLGKKCAWWLLLVLATLALISLLLRFLSPAVSNYRDDIAQFIGDKLQQPVTFKSLQLDWQGLDPRLQLDDAHFVYAQADDVVLDANIEHLSLTLSLWRSLLNFAPVFSAVDINAPHIQLYEPKNGWQSLKRSVAPNNQVQTTAPAQPLALARILKPLLLQPDVHLNTSLEIHSQQGEMLTIAPIELRWENQDTLHQLVATLQLPNVDADAIAKLVVQVQTNPADLSDFHLPFYLTAHEMDQRLLETLHLPVDIRAFQANTELWGEWYQNRLQRLQGNVQVDGLEIATASAPVTVDKASTQFALVPLNDSYQFQLSKLQFEQPNARIEIPAVAFDLNLAHSADELPIKQIQIPDLELKPITDWLLNTPALPAKAQEIIGELSPRGALHNAQLGWPEKGGWDQIQLVADADALGVDAIYGAPAIQGATGLLKADRFGGQIDLNSDRFRMYFPRLFPDPWEFVHADGIVRWHIQDDTVLVNSELLHLKDDLVQAAGRFSIDLPFAHDKQSELTLMIGMTDSQGTNAQRFIPPQEVGQALYDWVGRAVHKGHIRQAGFLLRAGTRHLENQHTKPVVQLFFDIDKGELDYQQGWPKVSDADLFLMIDNSALRIDIRSGKILNTDLKQGFVYLPPHSHDLTVAAQLSGPATDVGQVLRSQPLKSVGDALGDWHLKGKVDSLLNLNIPLQEGMQPQVDVAADLSHAEFSSQEERLTIKQLSGQLNYSTEKGLFSPQIKGSLFGEPITASIKTHQGMTDISGQGKADIKVLQDWLGIPNQKLVSGQLPYSTRLRLCTGPDAPKGCENRLHISSDMSGTQVHMPQQYGLNKPAKGALNIDVLLGKAARVDFNYRSLLFGRFDVNSQQPLQGILSFGEPIKQQPTRQLLIRGETLPMTLDNLLAVEDLIPNTSGQRSSTSSATKAQPAQIAPIKLDLRIPKLALNDHLALQKLGVKAQEVAKGWQLDLDADRLKGRVIVPKSATQPYQIHLTELNLPAPKEDKEAGAKSTSGLKSGLEKTNPDRIPNVEFAVDNLVLGPHNLGAWSANVRKEARQLRITDIAGQWGNIQFNGQIDWLFGSDHSGLTIKIKGSELGDALSKAGFQPVIDAEDVTSNLQLEWQGAPWDMQYAKIDGHTDFLLKDGRISDAGDAANLLRVFGVLNFNTLGRRLKLDFSDLYKEGVAFDRLEGEYTLSQGVATTVKPLIMKGPSADLKATGQLDFVQQTVDKDIEVVLPLTSNVPFAAVLLGAPQVAGAVFIIDKLIGDKLEKVTTLRYHAAGDWVNPQIELDGPGSKSLKDAVKLPKLKGVTAGEKVDAAKNEKTAVQSEHQPIVVELDTKPNSGQ